jgi:6-phosphogluconolactonase
LRFGRRIAAPLLYLLAFTTPSMAKQSLLYIATQDPQKMGIALAEFDPDTGTLSAPKLIAETRDPAHFTITRDGTHLYMCNTGTPGGVSAFAIDRETGAPKLLNHMESRGRGPSYISVDGSGRYVLDANYGGGYVEVLSLAKDGSLDQRTAMVEHTGSSVHPQRQTKPYAHWFGTDPSNKFALAADLGTDEIIVYQLDPATGKLAFGDGAKGKVPPGMGPRHLVFHPDGKWLYAIAELGNEVMAFNWDGRSGALAQFQSVKTLAADFSGQNTAAEIAIHANGRYLYASNRGEDTLVVYAIDEKTGELSFRQRISSRGRTPRYFTFDPSNKWLIVSNQEGASIVVFSVNARTGELAPVGEPVSLNKPMAVVFAPQ